MKERKRQTHKGKWDKAYRPGSMFRSETSLYVRGTFSTNDVS